MNNKKDNRMNLNTLLERMTEREAFDLHLTTGEAPAYRIGGKLERDGEKLADAAVDDLFAPYLADEHRALLSARIEVPLTIRHNGLVYRALLFREGGRLAAAVRSILPTVPTLERIGCPEPIRKLANVTRGLILVAGPTGSGKVTTASAFVETINQSRAARILVLDDRQDYAFTSKESLITQRVLGEDFDHMAQAARAALLMDTNVILFGEMRDTETLQTALLLAESGHLVISTMHSDGAVEAISRFIEAFPEPRDAVRRSLARNLTAVIGQELFECKPDAPEGRRRAAAYEVLIAVPLIRRAIESGNLVDLPMLMELHRAIGMRTRVDAVKDLRTAGYID
jgi:twitching motility protein PilT